MAQVYANTRIVVAEIAGGLPIMDQTANRILMTAKRKAADHRLTGAYMDGLHVEVAGKGKDRLVVAEGEGVIPIEFGGIVKQRKGKDISPYVIKPLRIMRDAYAAVKRV